MKYIIVKVIIKLESYDVEYGELFDNETDAIEQATKMNQLARKLNWADTVQIMVLPKEAE